MTTVQTNETKAAEKPAAGNGRKEETTKPAEVGITRGMHPAPAQATAPEAVDDPDETPDRFEVLAKIVRILKPLPPAERIAVIAAMTEMVR